MKFKIIYRDREIEAHNLITDRGYEEYAARLGCGSSELPFTYIAIGTDTTPPSPDDTSLGNELVRTESLYSYTSKAFELVAQFIAGSGTGSITEAGIFNSDYGGTMCARATFDPINKTETDDLVIIWTQNL